MGANRRSQYQSSETRTSGRHNISRNRYTKRYESKDKEKDNGILVNTRYTCVLLVIAVIVAVAHRNHIANLFESDRHFSHLSTLERELGFRTEMGLYYSYFKTMIESETFFTGLTSIMYDNITEYPLIINAFKRFNLYPEVALGAGYRTYEAVNAYFNRRTKQCWQINRGEGLSPVLSCDGLGEPSYFYVESIFCLNGIMIGIFFLFGSYLSGSLFGGLLTVSCFFYNHGEATRVQWTPPLRESFSYPFHVIQMFLVTHVLRIKDPGFRHSLLISSVTVCFMLPWQFAQFALLTQAVAVFGTYVLQYIDAQKFKVILLGQTMGLVISYILLFRNEMLLTSFFASCIMTLWAIVSLENFIEKLKFRIVIWSVQGLLLAVGTVGFKIVISRLFSTADDAHIGEIFKSKFSDFKNFHTMLYTCAKEFDFIEQDTFWRLLYTLLLPSAVVAMLSVLVFLINKEYSNWRYPPTSNGASSGDEIKPKGKPHAELVYHLLQHIAFAMMAFMIMRLKLFWTPHLCLMTSVLASGQIFSFIKRKDIHFALLALLLAGMSVKGFGNLQQQWSIKGEFSNVPMEELIEWVNTKTDRNAVFGGPMPIMATIKLCTQRPIVNHPHYEDAGLRARTMKVYSVFSRKPIEEVQQNFRDLKMDYLILEYSWCLSGGKEGCSLPEVWDIEDPANRGKTAVCIMLRDNPEPHFDRVFHNRDYDVLKILKS
ncbi:probable C-mannosyltransferase DPY19L1 [Gigantopelta aegis]|uniref:probable C-mannosyltransferase DPY19L1 n=1 Tax=Gigantopelta aegis TaxID=1735272 RepID=UPI001B8899D8|nr:probable C-mannosyltransferase DPY19L1 [Gigantopelta aegis]